jgi:hypothetical protein
VPTVSLDGLHELDWMHPLVATHTKEGTPSVVASLYQALPPIGPEPRYVQPATLEPRLR